MSRQQIKTTLEAKGFEVTEELMDQAMELQTLKEEGYSLPDNEEALEAFTQKWTHFCAVATMWRIIDQMGYKAGLWA